MNFLELIQGPLCSIPELPELRTKTGLSCSLDEFQATKLLTHLLLNHFPLWPISRFRVGWPHFKYWNLITYFSSHIWLVLFQPSDHFLCQPHSFVLRFILACHLPVVKANHITNTTPSLDLDEEGCSAVSSPCPALMLERWLLSYLQVAVLFVNACVPLRSCPHLRQLHFGSLRIVESQANRNILQVYLLLKQQQGKVKLPLRWPFNELLGKSEVLDLDLPVPQIHPDILGRDPCPDCIRYEVDVMGTRQHQIGRNKCAHSTVSVLVSRSSFIVANTFNTHNAIVGVVSFQNRLLWLCLLRLAAGICLFFLLFPYHQVISSPLSLIIILLVLGTILSKFDGIPCFVISIPELNLTLVHNINFAALLGGKNVEKFLSSDRNVIVRQKNRAIFKVAECFTWLPVSNFRIDRDFQVVQRYW